MGPALDRRLVRGRLQRRLIGRNSDELLERRPATTNPVCYEEFRPLVGELIDERVVDDGDRVTAGAVFCGADLGLWLV